MSKCTAAQLEQLWGTLPASPASLPSRSRSGAAAPRGPAGPEPGALGVRSPRSPARDGSGRLGSPAQGTPRPTRALAFPFLGSLDFSWLRATSVLRGDAAELSENTHKYKSPQMFPSGDNVPGLFQLFPSGRAPTVKGEPGAGLSPQRRGVPGSAGTRALQLLIKSRLCA